MIGARVRRQVEDLGVGETHVRGWRASATLEVPVGSASDVEQEAVGQIAVGHPREHALREGRVDGQLELRRWEEREVPAESAVLVLTRLDRAFLLLEVSGEEIPERTPS